MDDERQRIKDELTKNVSSKKTQICLNEKLKTNWKNSEESRRLRIEGNNLYTKDTNLLQMREIYKLYSQSIAFAENDSEELASAYGNRSAILFRMKKYKESITNIDIATKINNSDKFKIKLICRKIECMKLQGMTNNGEICTEVESLISAMNDEDSSKEAYQKEFEKSKSMPIAKVNRSEEKKVPKQVQKIVKDKENENPFDSVSIRWSKTYGRYLVANRDFNAGEVVLIEKPYVKVLNLKNSHKFCGHCLANSWATIPCNFCNWCMFCSEECKKTSWEQYHKIECNVVSEIIKVHGSISSYEQLTIRSLILGIKDAGSIENLKSQIDTVDTCTDKIVKGFESNGSCKSMGFQSLYTLNDDVVSIRSAAYTTKSIFILISLIKYTNSLFDTSLKLNLENLLTNDEVLFIGSLLLRLQKIHDKNSQQLPNEDLYECKYYSDPAMCSAKRCCNRGFCTMIVTSLINNNCHTQVTNVINKQSKFIVCSLRPIKKDSQIFLSYCGNFFDMKKTDRQMILRAGFNFSCNCEACKGNWPTMQELKMSIQRDPLKQLHLQFSKEKYHVYANEAITRPLIENYETFEVTLKLIETLSKAISKAYKDLNHPSLALFTLEKSMLGAIEKLYVNSI